MNKFLRIKLVFVFMFVSLPSFAGLITIDQNVQDTWWWNGYAQSNNTELRTNDVDFSNQRIGVQFNDLTALNNVEIVSAELQLYRYSGYRGSDADMTIDGYTITSSWDESSLQPSFDDYAITSTTYTNAQANGWQSWDITSLTQAWLMEEVINNGVMLAGIGDNSYQRFYGSEKAGFGPRLVINTVEVSEPATFVLFLLAIIATAYLNRPTWKTTNQKL